MQVLRQKWQNFRTYRRLQELWQDYKSIAQYDLLRSKQKDLTQLTKFLDTFKQAVFDLYSSSDHQNQIEKIFGDCGELLDSLLEHLKLYMQDGSIQTSEQNLSTFLNKILEVLELLVRSPKYREYVEESPDLVNSLLLLFEKVDNQEARVLALRLLTNLGIQGKKEVLRRGGVQKILQLLLDKNQNLSKEVIAALRHFLNAKPEAVIEESGGLSFRIKKVIGGVTKLASSLFPDESPTLDLSVHKEEVPNFPPSEQMLRQAASKFQTESRPLELPEELAHLQGALSTIVQVLKEAAGTVQLDLIETLSLLLCGNPKNKTEFHKLAGYELLSDSLNKVDTSSEEGKAFIKDSFCILRTIILDGKNSNTVGNLESLKFLFRLGAYSTNTKVAFECICVAEQILNINWENVILFYEESCLESLERTLARALESKELFAQLDGVLRYMSFLMGSAWEKNVEVLKIYTRVLESCFESLDKDLLEKLLDSLSGVVSDLNARCSINEVFQKTSFLGCGETMKETSEVVAQVFTQRGLGLETLCHLMLYELLFFETHLSSTLAIDDKTSSFPGNLRVKPSKSAQEDWFYEKYLMIKHGVWGCTEELLELLQEGRLGLVIKVLLMDEYPNLERHRGIEMRERFFSEGGLELILKNLSEEKYLTLLCVCTHRNPELKKQFFEKISPLELGKLLTPSAKSLQIALNLCIEKDYLQESCIVEDILNLLPGSSSSVASPKLLFECSNNSLRSTTCSSTLVVSKVAPQLSSKRLVQGNNVLMLLAMLLEWPQSLQVQVTESLCALADSYHNKKVLQTIEFSKTLLQVAQNLPEVSTLLEKLLSYSCSAQEAKVLLDLTREAWAESIMINCLHLELASSFYVLDHSTLEAPTLKAFPKAGYSVSFWVKLKSTPTEQVPLFSWVDHNRGILLLQLSYNSEGPFLGIRAPTQALFPSSEDYANYHTELNKDWNHIALVHSKPGIVIYLNGKAFPLYKCTHFAAFKEKCNVTGVFGDKKYRAAFSGIKCIGGVLESSQILSTLSEGVVNDLKVSEKLVFKLPELEREHNSYCSAEVSQTQGIQVGSFKIVEKREKLTPVLDEMHTTKPFKLALCEANAIPEFFSMLRSPKQALGLKCLCESIVRCSRNYASFIELGGWELLGGIILNNTELSEGSSLEYLISAIANRPYTSLKLKKMLSIKPEQIPTVERVEGLLVVCELLCNMPGEKTIGIIESLSNLMYREENVKLFLSSEVNGVCVLLELVNKLSNPKNRCLEYHILTLFEHLLNYVSTEQLESILDYLVSPDLSDYSLEIEDCIESMLSLLSVNIFVLNNSILDKFLTCEGNLLLLELVRSSSEKIRCSALKLIGLLLSNSSRFKSWFRKVRGFEMLTSILLRHTNSKMTYEILSLISVRGFLHVSFLYPPHSGHVKAIINMSAIAYKALPNQSLAVSDKVVYPEALETLLEILKLETSDQQKLEVFKFLEEKLNQSNCEKLIESGFILSFANFLKTDWKETSPKSKQSSKLMYELFTKLVFFDMNRHPKQMKTLNYMSKVAGSEDFHIVLFEKIINAIEANPNFDDQNGYVEQHLNFLKNLIVFLQNPELLTESSELSARVMHLINLLASNNTPSVRSQMKVLGYFDLRDNLLLQTLRSNPSQSDLWNLLIHFSFETLASQAKFRESNALFYFIKFLMESEYQTQEFLLKTIREDICIHDENKKQLNKLIDNKAFLEFVGAKKEESTNSIAHCFRSMKNTKLTETEDPPENLSDSETLSWLNSSELKRIIMSQVNKQIAPVEAELKKCSAKLTESKNARRKKVSDLINKEKAVTQKILNETESKLAARISKAQEKSFLQSHSRLGDNKRQVL